MGGDQLCLSVPMRREYQDWAKKCYYCQIDLVDKLPDVPQESVFDVSSDPLVTIASFSYPQEAYLHQALLDYTGIDCFVADDYIVTANWLYATAVAALSCRSGSQMSRMHLQY